MKNTVSPPNLERRQFIKMLSKASVSTAMCRALPLVGGLMANRRAHAQNGTSRVVFVYTSNGAPNGLWLPSGRQLNLASAGYEGLQNICNFREVEVIGSGHGNPRKSMGELRWSQNWTGDTLDQQIASVIGTNTPYTSFALGVETDGTQLIGRKSGVTVATQEDPSAAYQQLFGGSGASDGNQTAQKQSIMDIHHQALSGLKNRLGQFERSTLEKHEAALLEIEKRLNNVSSAPTDACANPSWNARGYSTQNSPDVPFAHKAELQSDIITAAFACGITKVMTLQLGWHQATMYGHDTAFRGDHHNSCHSAPAEANAEMTNYLSRCVAYLIQRLAEEDDPAVPGTKLIDNTVVVQVTDMGDGRDHTAPNGPNMVATRMASFKQGTVARGGTNYQVLEAVAQGLGLGAYIGEDVNSHRIWPCAGNNPDTSLLT